MAMTTTGISGMDAQLGGGIPRGSTLLLMSEPGNVIGAFAEQFAGGGLNVGEQVYFYQFDRTTDEVRDSVLQFAPKAGNGDGEAPLQVFDGYAPRFGGKAKKNGVTPVDRAEGPSEVLNTLHNAPPDPPLRLVIESLTTLVEERGAEEALDFVEKLVFMAREMDATVLLTLVKDLHEDRLETRLCHLVDGVLETGVEKKGFGLYSYLVIKKMLGVPDPARIMLFQETEKGLWLESTERVF